MGLNLSKAGVVDSDRLKSRAQGHYQMLEQVEKELLEDLGVEPMPAPETTPDPLANLDVGALSDRELGSLYSQYTAYSVFLNGRLAKLVGLERASKGNLKKVVATIKNELRAEGVKEAEMAARVELHPLFEEYYVESLKLFMMKEIAEAYYKGYRDMAAALSRNITLRELEFEQLRREDSIQKVKTPSTPQRGLGKRFGGRRG